MKNNSIICCFISIIFLLCSCQSPGENPPPALSANDSDTSMKTETGATTVSSMTFSAVTTISTAISAEQETDINSQDNISDTITTPAINTAQITTTPKSITTSDESDTYPQSNESEVITTTVTSTAPITATETTTAFNPYEEFDPQTLNDFLLRFEHDLKRVNRVTVVDIRLPNTRAKEIDAVEYIMDVFKNNSDTKAIIGYTSEDEIEFPITFFPVELEDEMEELYKNYPNMRLNFYEDEDFIFALEFGKDLDGNTWIWYPQLYSNWLVILENDKDFYEVLTSL